MTVSQVADAKVTIFINICIKAYAMKLQLYLPFTTEDKIRSPGSGQQQHPKIRVQTYSIFLPSDSPQVHPTQERIEFVNTYPNGFS